MKDPFMYDAIDGFDSINDDHIERINSIHKRLNRKTQAAKKKKHHYHLWQISAASAAAVLIFAAGGYFYKSNYQTNLYSENTGDRGVIKIYVPEEYYTENVVVIAKHNVEAVRAVDIHKYKAAENGAEVVKAEDELSGSDKVLDVYMPE
jgi:predicted membrane-bound mannosyltransferase